MMDRHTVARSGCFSKKLLVHRLIIGGRVIRHPFDEQASRSVGNGIVQLELPGVLILVENELEMDRKPFICISIVRPYLGWINVHIAGDKFFVDGRAEDDIDAAPIGHPSFACRTEPEPAVRFLKTLRMLGHELVLRRPRRGVAQPPERLDEKVPLAIRRQVQEDVPLLVPDDVGHELQPILICGRQVLRIDLGLTRPEERRERDEDGEGQKHNKEKSVPFHAPFISKTRAEFHRFKSPVSRPPWPGLSTAVSRGTGRSLGIQYYG